MKVSGFLKSKAGISLIITVLLGAVAVACVTCGIALSPYFVMAGCTSIISVTAITRECQFSEHYCNLLRDVLLESAKSMNQTEIDSFVQKHGTEPDKIPHCPSVWLVIAGLLSVGIGWLAIIGVMILTIVKPSGKVTSILVFVCGSIFTVAILLLLQFFIFLGLSHFPCRKVGSVEVFYSVVSISCESQRTQVYQLVPFILGTIFVGGTALAAFFCGCFLRFYPPRRVGFSDDGADHKTKRTSVRRQSRAVNAPTKRISRMTREEETSMRRLILSEGTRKSATSIGSQRSAQGRRKNRGNQERTQKSWTALAMVGHDEEDTPEPDWEHEGTKKKKKKGAGKNKGKRKK